MLLKNVLLYSIFTTTSTDAAFQKSHFFALTKPSQNQRAASRQDLGFSYILHRWQMFWIPSPFGEKKGAAPFLTKALSLRGALPQKIKKKVNAHPRSKMKFIFSKS
jgi:hypothetical protein